MAAHVLLVCPDLHQNDQLMGELADAGLEATPAFSADEALAVLSRERFDAIVMAEELEEGMAGLMRYISKKHRGILVTLPERRSELADEEIALVAEAGVLARLVAVLSEGRAPLQ